MKTLKFFLIAVLALGVSRACSDDGIQGQNPDDLSAQNSLKSKLLGEWVAPNQESRCCRYAFANDDTIYVKTPEGDTLSKWPYEAIAGDSIRITRGWTTHSKVAFYSNDSIWIGDFVPSMAAVYPPEFGDIVLVRAKEASAPEENPKLTGAKWKLKSFVANGVAKAPEPEDNDSYWIAFKDDSTLEGKSSVNFLFGSYEVNHQTSYLRVTNLGGTKIAELLDGRFFVESLMAVRSFELREDALKLCYNETDYLLFNVYQDSGSKPPLVLTVADFNVPAGCGVSYSKMQHDSVYVINSEEEWATIFTCESNPPIDFSTKTLLAAFGGTTNGIANISKKLLLEHNTYSLAVDITLDMTAVAQGWRIILISDKVNMRSVNLSINKHFGNENIQGNL